MAGATATAGEHAARRQDAVHVVGFGFGANQDDGFLFDFGQSFRGIGIEDDLSDGSTRCDVESGGNQIAGCFALFLALGSNCGCKSIRWARRDTQDGFFGRDQSFVGKLDCDANGGLGGALGVAGLQNPQLAALDGELDVLNVAVVAL